MTAPPKKCSYVESQELPPCDEQDQGNGFCVKHNGPLFSVCTGCSGHATHLCPCRAPLCGDCTHHPGSGSPGDPGRHGPREDAANAYQEPTEAPPLENLAKVREDLEEAVLLSMRTSTRDGLTERATAARVVADLGTTVMLTILSGLQNATAQEGTPA